MAKVEFHSDLKKQQDNAEFAKKLERLLGLIWKDGRPVFGPDQPQRRWTEQKPCKNLADGQGLADAFSEPAKNPRHGNNDHPFQQDQFQMAFDGFRIHLDEFWPKQLG